MLFQIQDIPPAAMAVAAAVLVIVAFVAGKLCSKQSVAPEGSEDGAGKAATSENPVANAVVASRIPNTVWLRRLRLMTSWKRIPMVQM